MVRHYVGVVLLFVVQGLQRLHILSIQSNVLCPHLLFKSGLFLLKVLHQAFVKYALLLDFLFEDLDLLPSLIDFIVWHVDRAQNVWLLCALKIQSGLYFFNSGLR